MEWSTVLVAIIAALGGLGSSLIVARSTSEKLPNQLALGQAVQNERIDNFQKVTNDNINQLRAQVTSHAEYGTRLALCEAEIKRLKEEKAS